MKKRSVLAWAAVDRRGKIRSVHMDKFFVHNLTCNPVLDCEVVRVRVTIEGKNKGKGKVNR